MTESVKTSPVENSRVYFKSRSRPPLFFILFPVILGYFLGRYYPGVNTTKLVLFGIFLLGLWLMAWERHCHRLFIFRILGIAAIVLLAWGHYIVKQPPNIDGLHLLNPREVTLTLRVLQTFDMKDALNQKGGYGIITQAPKHLEWALGQYVFYQLIFPSEKEEIYRSSVVEVQGILSALEEKSSFAVYLKTQGVQYQMQRGQIASIQK